MAPQATSLTPPSVFAAGNYTPFSATSFINSAMRFE